MIDEVMNSEESDDCKYPPQKINKGDHFELKDYTNQNFLVLIEAKN